MKKLLSAVFVAILLISMLPGASTALAQDAENERGAATGIAVDSANRTTRQTYAVDDTMMNELNRLLKMLSEAEEKGDRELVAALQEKIRVLQQEISRAINITTTATSTGRKPTVGTVAEPVKPQTDEEKPTASSAGGAGSTGTITVSNTADSCRELEAVQSKKKYYDELYGLSDDELKAKGYARGRAEIQGIVAELDDMMTRLRKECEAGNTNRVGGGEPERTRTSTATGISKVTISAKPVTAESGIEISDYYKRRIAEIATEETDINKQVAVLKELRDEIDRLIEGLIKSKDSINTKDVKGLVEKIQVTPGQVRMDKVTVATTNKRVMARIGDRDLEIQPTSGQVMLNDGNLEVKAKELSIENEALRVGNVEVKLMPSAALQNVRATPKEMELAEEDSKPVYKIKTDENRKLLGMIPIKLEKTTTVDASNTNANVIKEQRPWWAFLTTGTQ
ncbi:hypothetical protein ACFLYN_05505 [Chloroflexota bacterium]